MCRFLCERFQLMGKCQRVQLLDYILRVIFSFVRNYQMVFQSGRTILHFHQQGMRVLTSSHPHQHLVLSVFCILAILIGV